jgi:hypothetical protein
VVRLDARVRRDRSCLANGPDVRVPFAAELQRIESGAAAVEVPLPALGPGFGSPEEATFEHSVRQTGDQLFELVSSRASFIRAPADVRARVERETAALAATLPPEFELPYVTSALRAAKREDAPGARV